MIRVEDKKLNDWLNYQLAEGRGITPGDGYDEFYLEDEDGNVYEGKYIWESEGFERLSINGEALEHNVVSFQHNGEGENFSIIAISVDYEYPSDEFWENVHADADAGNAVARLISGTKDYWEYPAAIADKIRKYAKGVPGWIDGEEPLLFNEI